MILLGAVLLIAGLVFGVSLLSTIGIVVLVIGLVLALVGSLGRPIGGRRHYY
ncbi:DUF6131 family protein [Nocardia rhizosphaerae]|uniref:DUF6131 family protein n=1 Tax=Nocardia rhizosphaerae TaxID=1691571 RepID=A0ABV8L5V7_9NOCA